MRKIIIHHKLGTGFLLLLIIAAPKTWLSFGEAATPNSSAGTSTQNSTKTITYIVRTGDSLFGIARHYMVSMELIKKINHLISDRIYVGQMLMIPVENKVDETPSHPVPIPPTVSLPPVQSDPPVPNTANPIKNVLVTIDKSDHTLTLSIDGAVTKTYSLALGDGGPDDKTTSGDHRTPEGEFYVTEMKTFDPPDPIIGSRWIRLSYPNAEDADRGLKQGLIDQKTRDEIVKSIANQQTPPQYTVLGSAVGIHGGNTPVKGSNWTWGSAAMSNADIEELFDQVQVGTVVIIKK